MAKLARIEQTDTGRPAVEPRRQGRRCRHRTEVESPVVALESRSALLHPKAADALVLAAASERGDGEAGDEDRAVVAVVFEDGTVRRTDAGTSEDGAGSYEAGQLSGEDWILWWERRSFDDAG